MRSVIFLTSVLTFIALGTSGQHLIGFNKQEVREIVKAEWKGFRPDNSVVNSSFNYMRFVNSSGTKTLIVFFDEKDISSGVRLMCDYSELDLLITEYNSKFKLAGKGNWEYAEGHEIYKLTIEEKEWYFVVHIRKQEQLQNNK